MGSSQKRPGRSGKLILISLVSFFGSVTADANVELGIDVLQKSDYTILRGKRVGLVTNQTGVNSHGVRTRVLLHQNCNLVALFTPEHGLDGTELAGRYVKSRRDRLTGVMAYSLYGPTRKPTPEILQGVEILVFDLQDIGSRSYTYISTMGKCMEAAAENHIPFVVLDRPNPLGGRRIEGPSIDPAWISFVGQFPIPYVHGMTIGELARMVNARGWAGSQCDLTVIPMHGWSRDMIWKGTGLRWIRTSPNIPRQDSPFYYVATGIVGELDGIETGIGGSEPFETISASWLSAEDFTRYLSGLETPGVKFRAFAHGRQQGSRIKISGDPPANLAALGIHMLAEINRASGNNLFRRSSRDKLDLFFKVYGSSSIRTELEHGVTPGRIVSSWQAEVAKFRSARARFLLY